MEVFLEKSTVKPVKKTTFMEKPSFKKINFDFIRLLLPN